MEDQAPPIYSSSFKSRVLILKRPLTLLLWVDTSASHAVYKTGPLNHVRSIVYGQQYFTFQLPFLKSSTPANILTRLE